jgi:hypothetical protein
MKIVVAKVCFYLGKNPQFVYFYRFNHGPINAQELT